MTQADGVCANIDDQRDRHPQQVKDFFVTLYFGLGDSMAVPAELIEALNGATVPDKRVRETAEAYLTTCQLQSGFLQSLLTVVADATAELGLREIAAITLKNEIRVRWSDWASSDLPTQIENESKSCYDDITKQSIKENLLKVYLALPLSERQLRRQVEEAINKLIIHDYPDWDEVNTVVVACLSQTENVQALISGLNVLRRVTGKYEITTRSEIVESKIESFLSQVGPLMLSIVAKMKDNLFASVEAAFVVKMIAKIYWSMTTISSVESPYLAASQNDWLQFADLVLVTAVPENVLPLDVVKAEQIDQCPAIKAKKWVLQTLRRFFSCFATSRTVTSGKDQTVFATQFVKCWAVPFLNRLIEIQVAYISVLSSGSNQQGRILTPKLQSIVIEYFTHGLEMAEAYKAMKPKIDFLVTKVIHPALSYTEEDVMSLMEDPIDYAWESTSSFNMFLPPTNSPRGAASEFIRALPRLRGRDFLEPVATFCLKQMENWNLTRPEQRGMGSEASRLKEGALVMLGEFAARLCNKKRSTSVESIIYTYILPHLESNDDIFLKMRCCWAAGRLINPSLNIIEGEGKIENPEKFLYTFQKLLECSTHDNIAVRVHAISALAAFVLISQPMLNEYIKSVMSNFIDVILATLEKIKIENIMTTLNFLVQRFPDEIIPHAQKLMKYLVTCALAACRDEECDSATEGSPYSFASASQTEKVDSAFAAFSLLKTINTVLEIISEPQYGDLFDAITPELVPFFDAIMTPENEEFLEDALQALAYVTFYPTTFSPCLWKYYERMYQAVCGGSTPHLEQDANCTEGFAADSVRFMVPCLDNYLNQSKATFLTGRCAALNLTYKQMYMEIIQRSFEGDFDPDSPAFALQLLWLLADNFVDSIDSISDLIQPALKMAWGYMLQPKQPISKSMREEMAKFVLTLLYAKPEGFLTLSQELGVLSQTTAIILDPSVLKHYEGKKIWVLAMIHLIRMGRTNPSLLPPELATNPNSIVVPMSRTTLDIISLRQSDEDEESEWDSVDSEQELDENDDAQPTTLSSTLLQCLTNSKDDDKDDTDYEVNTCDNLGDRLSPLDAVPELALVQNFINECEAGFLQILGQADAQQLARKIEEELQRQEKEQAE
eukprot:Gregarina_sp_Poly_1__413@NODE_10_length_23460_cov_121_463087_g8_i1_p2_GENE_NODE_10_length_23460_cov_121_463087_g8_i1NODE_10_length_23460_cov_121_463087_g8_i1_p2_ORF_typecomplete_len1123_score189_89Cse1/PF08506_10/3_9e26Cse1/PF08506_10/34IBN_N/PF03810_19/2_1e10IFRD/PF05004_13/0_031IFRD/PF05004_13/1_3e02Mannitol_dh_C/PF08125_13/1_1Mannitol_dh_C/PF08125_13/1e02HEAT_2/PF13646_6/4_2e02HEAT_2/PF13646_6/2_5Vac14_Fab1_bd/PF12755_7/1e04Vac14_Fab1_bd/PF12755_7/5_7Vac14_Fab1_bd/PF12755_7/5_8e02Cnd3/PF12719